MEDPLGKKKKTKNGSGPIILISVSSLLSICRVEGQLIMINK